jgi:hypothetical protein
VNQTGQREEYGRRSRPSLRLVAEPYAQRHSRSAGVEGSLQTFSRFVRLLEQHGVTLSLSGTLGDERKQDFARVDSRVTQTPIHDLSADRSGGTVCRFHGGASPPLALKAGMALRILAAGPDLGEPYAHWASTENAAPMTRSISFGADKLGTASQRRRMVTVRAFGSPTPLESA